MPRTAASISVPGVDTAIHICGMACTNSSQEFLVVSGLARTCSSALRYTCRSDSAVHGLGTDSS